MEKEKIISLAREYVENTKCSCSIPGVAGCWHCLFEYNLNFVDAIIPARVSVVEGCIEDGNCEECLKSDCVGLIPLDD